ncbi:hypothetical protein VPH35_129917 [Triticum aestivum]
MEVDVYSSDTGAAVPQSPLATDGADAGCVLNEDSATTPSSRRRGSGGSGRPPKKTVGRKATVKAGAVMVAEQNRGDLGMALASVGAGANAKRSKVTHVALRAPSVHAKAKPDDLSSLESTKLHTADKNLEVSDLDTVGETA